MGSMEHSRLINRFCNVATRIMVSPDALINKLCREHRTVDPVGWGHPTSTTSGSPVVKDCRSLARFGGENDCIERRNGCRDHSPGRISGSSRLIPSRLQLQIVLANS